MPTKKRLAREKELILERARKADELRAIDQSITPEIKRKISSRGISSLNTALAPSLPALNNVGIKFEDDGQISLSPNHCRGGADHQANEKKDRIKELKRKYPEYWCVRNGAKKITQKENLSIETVRRYFRESRKTLHTK
jgi:hypothetical protein